MRITTISFILLLSLSIVDSATVTVKIEKPKGSGNFIEKDVVEFIEDGKKRVVDGCEIRPSKQKVVMVMGLTGTGKSTLVNYLNGIPLVCVKMKDKWILDLQSENNKLPCGFAIGHGTKSETLYPAVYSPPNTDFAYVDNPGFRDTRGFGIEIANGFFREQVTSGVTGGLKFLLLITHPDLKLRGQQFRDSMKGFSDFLGVFDSPQSSSVSKSIGIIVTRVENDGDTDEQMKEIFKEKLLEIINEEIETRRITAIESNIFKQVVNNNQIEIFSNPKVRGLVSSVQSNQMMALINKLNFINKNDLKIRVRISENYLPQLRKYTDLQLSKLSPALSVLLSESLNGYFDREMKNLRDLHHLGQIYSNLNEFVVKSGVSGSLESLMKNLNEQVVPKKLKDEFLNKKVVVDYFIDIMPTEFRPPRDMPWTDQKVVSRVKDMMDEMIRYFDKQYKNFQSEVEMALDQGISAYFPKRVDEAASIDDIIKLSQLLNQLATKGSQESVTIEAFLSDIDDTVLSKNTKDGLFTKNNAIKEFVTKLPAEKQASFSSIRKWIGVNLSLKLRVLVSEIQKFNTESHHFENGVFTYKGNFIRMSSVLESIKNVDYIRSLKRVNVYATHSLTFDCDYVIDKTKYDFHAPDLVLISPRVIAAVLRTIDLSCHFVPSYPKNQVKASDAVGYLASGDNGLPGLAGGNSGNLLVFTESIDYGNLRIVLEPGRGGPGQHGGNGHEGKTITIIRVPSNEKCKWYDLPCHLGRKRRSLADCRGGDAGRGGCGGKGGFGGSSIVIVRMNGGDTPQFIDGTRKIGVTGTAGQPGQPGLGGLYDGQRAASGRINHECIPANAAHPITTIDQAKMKREYLAFVNELSNHLPKCNLLSRRFMKSNLW